MGSKNRLVICNRIVFLVDRHGYRILIRLSWITIHAIYRNSCLNIITASRRYFLLRVEMIRSNKSTKQIRFYREIRKFTFAVPIHSNKSGNYALHKDSKFYQRQLLNVSYLSVRDCHSNIYIDSSILLNHMIQN